MNSRYSNYPEYKKSGVKWLGCIPNDWAVKKLKYICNVQTGNKDTVNAVNAGEYPFFVRSQTVERINSFSADCEAVLTAGDGVGVGKVFHYYQGKFDYHQRVYMLNNFSGVIGKFVFFYLSNNFYKVALEGNAKSTVDSLRLPQFLNFEFSLPCLETQAKVVDFLDYETAKIDTLIDKQQQLIKLLKEKRQAVISHAVTKGLNPDAPMKDSGVEWLGEVPEHWDCCFIKLKTLEITDGAHISPELKNGIHHFISIRDVKDWGIDFENALLTSNLNYQYLVNTGCKPNAGDVLFSKDGTIGKTVVVPEKKDFVVASSLIIIRPDQRRLSSTFFDYLCQSSIVQEQVNSFVKGAALKRLSIQNLLKVWGIFPPLEEQIQISDFISKKLDKYKKIEKEAITAINLMQERRTALISAAVTGKIDVRNWQLEQPKSSMEATA
jgi:type I restriction enzyme S subunit